MLLGGGGSFSAGGPGKGMFSRLCKLSRIIQALYLKLGTEIKTVDTQLQLRMTAYSL